jgi:hypothetical protein
VKPVNQNKLHHVPAYRKLKFFPNIGVYWNATPCVLVRKYAYQQFGKHSATPTGYKAKAVVTLETPNVTTRISTCMFVSVWRPRTTTHDYVPSVSCMKSLPKWPRPKTEASRPYPWFQASAAMLMRSALFWGITRRRMVTIYPLPKDYHPTLHNTPEERISQVGPNSFWKLVYMCNTYTEDRGSIFPRNVRDYIPNYWATHSERH